MARAEKVKVAVEVHGLDATVRAFRGYSKEMNAEIRDAATAAVAETVPALVAAMMADGRQSAMVATTIAPVRDRVPALKAGGNKRVAPTGGRRRNRPPAGDVFFGAEFGGQGRRTTQQFRPHTGTTGYAFYPMFRRHTGDIIDAYGKALDRLAADWEH
jgi:hypothetical protein